MLAYPVVLLVSRDSYEHWKGAVSPRYRKKLHDAIVAEINSKPVPYNAPCSVRWEIQIHGDDNAPVKFLVEMETERYRPKNEECDTFVNKEFVDKAYLDNFPPNSIWRIFKLACKPIPI